MKIVCAHCGKKKDKPIGEVNRAKAAGLRLFCNRRCAGLGRRKPRKPKAQRIKEKCLYDAAYRKKNRAVLKAKKAVYFKQTYDPAKARVERKKRSAAHSKYCRRPEYKRYKREYDRLHRAQEYGPFAEAYMLALDLNREIKGRMTNEQIRRENETWAKTQARARSTGEQRTRDRHRAA